MDLLPLWLAIATMLLGVPVAIALGAGSLLFFLTAPGLPAAAFAQKLQSSFGSFPLLAIPLFMLAGAILNVSGIAGRLFDLARAMLGRTSGASAKIAVVLSTLMGGITASAAADASMLAKLVGQPMILRGYPRPFIAALIASSSMITPIIPPGIGLILYGAMTETSIGQLFAAGVVPGLLMALGLVATVHLVARRRGYEQPSRSAAAANPLPAVEIPRLGHALKRAWIALLLPAFIVVGIRYGVFTPTEAGGVLVLISLILGVAVYRQVRPRDVADALIETGGQTASLMLIVAFSTAFAFYLTWEGIPQMTAHWVAANFHDPIVILLMVNLVMLITGILLETVPAMIILVPILHPIALSAGIDPVHMGIVVVLNLTIGSISPPVGLIMFLVNAALRVSVAEFTRASWPFFLAFLLILLAVTLVPAISLTLPRALY